MKKYNLFTLPGCIGFCMLIFSTTSYSQADQTIVNPDPGQLNFTSSLDVYRFLNGQSVRRNDKPAIDASTLLYPDWITGIVNFQNGKQFRNAELKFDLVRNELYFKNNNTTNIFADPVSSFYLIDTANGINKTAGFRNGYPGFGQLSVKSYYLLLTSGPRLHLLKYIAKNKRHIYEYGTSAKTIYHIAEDLFVYDVKDNSLHIINKHSVPAVEKALPLYEKQIRQWGHDKKKKNLTVEEIIDLINQVNNSATRSS